MGSLSNSGSSLSETFPASDSAFAAAGGSELATAVADSSDEDSDWSWDGGGEIGGAVATVADRGAGVSVVDPASSSPSDSPSWFAGSPDSDALSSTVVVFRPGSCWGWLRSDGWATF